MVNTMTQETPAGETPSQPDEVMYCATHPKVETTLRCGKCGTPICPKCMVMTPVGARCRTCANVRPMAMYEVKPELLLRGLLAGVVSALIGAAIFLFFLRAFIFFTSFF